jgi:pilus assembly protein CpaE
VLSVGVVDGAIGGVERFASVAALFPHIGFEVVGAAWPERSLGHIGILIVGVDATSSTDVDAALRRLKAQSASVRVVVVLRNADVTTTRRLMREGAADILPAPVSEPALALCLERLLVAGGPHTGPDRKAGEVVALLKAGGGVGATALGVQVAAMLAARGQGLVCLADLDLQSGEAGLYLDLPDAVTIADCLSSGPGLEDTPFSTALAIHGSGARLLAAPREIVALETLGPAQAEALMTGLRRDFALTIVDLPPVWTAWTNQVLNHADRIVLITHLSVPHVQLVKRQLRVLASQKLEDRPLILVCNSLSADHAASVSIKAAERALGRDFDVIIPEDRRTMTAALNEGRELSDVRRGTKLEKAIGELADKVAATAPAAAKRGWR